MTPHDLRVGYGYGVWWCGYGVGKPDLQVTRSKRYLEGEQTETIMLASTPSISLHTTTQLSAFQLGHDLTNVKKFPLNLAM